jgi:hypothetical protein
MGHSKEGPFIKVGKLLKFRQEDFEAWLKRQSQEGKKDFLDNYY